MENSNTATGWEGNTSTELEKDRGTQPEEEGIEGSGDGPGEAWWKSGGMDRGQITWTLMGQRGPQVLQRFLWPFASSRYYHVTLSDAYCSVSLSTQVSSTVSRQNRMNE